MDAVLNIDVPDVRAAVDFHERGIGLQLRRMLFNGTVAEMIGAPMSIHLIEKRQGTSPSPSISAPRDYARHWTPGHLDFAVPDLDVAGARACAAGANLEGAIQTDVWGRLATMSDPFGHGFCFIQWVESGYDAVKSCMRAAGPSPSPAGR